MPDTTRDIIKRTESSANLFIRDIGSRVLKFAARDYEGSTFLGSAIIAIASDEKLQRALETDQGRISLYHALQRGAVTGLSLNPQVGEAALVAYENKKEKTYKITYQIMKNGLVKLALSSGAAESVSSYDIREKDEIKITHGARSDDYQFSPALKDRGPIIGYLASMCREDIIRVAYMSKEEVSEHMERYATSLNLGDRSPWRKDFDGMARKTVIKRLLTRTKFAEKTYGSYFETMLGAEDISGEPLLPEKGTSAEDATKLLQQKNSEQTQVEKPKPESIF